MLSKEEKAQKKQAKVEAKAKVKAEKQAKKLVKKNKKVVAPTKEEHKVENTKSSIKIDF